MRVEIGRSLEGHPVLLDEDNAINKHTAIIGASGSGKTVEAQFILKQVSVQMGTVVALNFHGALDSDQVFPAFREDFDRLAVRYNAHDEGLPMDLFEPLVHSDGSGEDQVDTINAATDVLCRAAKLGLKHRGILRTAIEQAWQRNLSVTCEEVGKSLKGSSTKDISEVYERLHFLFERNIFTKGQEVFTAGRINIIDLCKFDPGIQQILQEIILSQIWRLANAGRFKESPIYLFVDEIQNAASGVESALASLIAEGRKMGVNLILATQLVLQNTDKSVQQRLPQCGLLLFSRPVANRMKQTARMINPGDIDAWVIRLRNLKVGQFVAVGNFKIKGVSIDYPMVIDARFEPVS